MWNADKGVVITMNATVSKFLQLQYNHNLKYPYDFGFKLLHMQCSNSNATSEVPFLARGMNLDLKTII